MINDGYRSRYYSTHKNSFRGQPLKCLYQEHYTTSIRQEIQACYYKTIRPRSVVPNLWFHVDFGKIEIT